MSRPLPKNEVLTLLEAARFLRLRPAKVRTLAEQGAIPGYQFHGEWRFLKAALEDQLRGKRLRDSADVFLSQAGSLKDDDTLPDLLETIYKARGRPMIDDQR